MITINEIGSAIYGAYRLARRDPGGMAYFDRTRKGAIRSFYAAILLLPFHAIIVAGRWWDDMAILSLQRMVAIESLTYVISWTIFPVLMIWIARSIDRSDRYYDFLVSFNWASLVTIVARFPLFVIRRLELLPEPIADILVLALVVAVLLYRWYVLKTALNIGGGLAGGLTAAALFASLLIRDVASTLIDENG